MNNFSALYLKYISEPKKEVPTQTPPQRTFMEIRNGKITGLKKF